jgi:hypothetical protein
VAGCVATPRPLALAVVHALKKKMVAQKQETKEFLGGGLGLGQQNPGSCHPVTSTARESEIRE